MAHLWQQLEDVEVSEDKPASEDRLILLCDGIFAIAITLLVLDIRIPDISSSLTDAQQHLAFQKGFTDFLYKILFYFITFVVIASYWAIHRRIMHNVRRLDRTFIWLTFLFLSFVALFPATMALVATYGSYPQALIVYVLTMAACGFSTSFLWIYASWNYRLIDRNIPKDVIVLRIINTLIQPTYYALSLLLLFLPTFQSDPPRICFSWVFIAVPARIVQQIYRRRLARQAQEEAIAPKQEPEMRPLAAAHDPEPAGEPTIRLRPATTPNSHSDQPASAKDANKQSVIQQPQGE